MLLVAAALFYVSLTQEPKTDVASEKLICEAAAKRLSKDPNDMTDEDYAKIKILHFAEIKHDNIGNSSMIVRMQKDIADISLLKKFTNLEKLNFSNIRRRYNVPSYMKILAGFGIVNLENRYAIDLSPLSSLKSLQTIDLNGCPIKNLDPLSKLTNLKMLDISDTLISDMEPLKKLTNLEQLLMMGCKNITDKQVEDLQKALPNLKIVYSQTMSKNTPVMFNLPYRPMWQFNDYLPEVEQKIKDPNITDSE